MIVEDEEKNDERREPLCICVNADTIAERSFRLFTSTSTQLLSDKMITDVDAE